MYEKTELKNIYCSTFNSCQKICDIVYKSYLLPFTKSIHFIIILYILQKMENFKDSVKDFTETSESFRPKQTFNCHHNRAEREYKIFEQNQAKAIYQLLNEKIPTEEKVSQIISYCQGQANKIIAELLNEAIQLRKKLKNRQDHYQHVIRTLQLHIRNITEEKIELSSLMKVSDKTNGDHIEKLKKNNMKENQQACEMKKQIEGLRSLTSEYQQELQNKDAMLHILKIQCNQKIAQTKQNQDTIEQYLTENIALKEQLKDKQFLILVHMNQIKLFQERIQVLLKEMNTKNEAIVIFQRQFRSKNQEKADYQLIISQLKHKIEEQKCLTRDCINKLSHLQATSNNAFKNITQKCNNKIRLMRQLVKKAFNKMRKQIQILKKDAIKEVYNCLKQTKRTFIQGVQLSLKK